MANESRGKVLQFIQNSYIAVVVVLVVFLIFIPIPKVLIDLCMILNLAFSIIILLSVIVTPRASDFQTYPRIILFETMFGLGINISSTRLILLKSGRIAAGGYSNEQSAMVQAFAKIVAGDNIVIGFVIFIILIVVQVIVVTKGAGRVSEVAARFSLDSMSQKFFDVDNRLNSGMIDDQEAMRLKDSIRKEIDFYSNMDGSSKFVSGNVKAGIFITVINLVGGFIVGMAMHGMDFQSALRAYSILTIGDGLMSQLPALIISFATGILVTGTKSDEDLGEQVKKDFTRDGHIYEIVGAVLIVAGVLLRSGTQFLLVPVGALFIFIGYRLAKNQIKQQQAIKQAEEQARATDQKSSSLDSESITMLDPLSLELGYALIPLVSKEKGAELLERITRIRNEAKLDMGFVIPKIRIQDNMTLDPNDYSFKIKGIEYGHANIRLGYYMCMDTGAVITPLKGEKTKDPAFGMDAIWLPEDRRAEAEEAGYVVVDPPTIIATHLTEIIRAHAAEMLGRQEVSSIIETVKERNPVLVNEVLNEAKLTYGQIEKVLQNLLDENVSIRNIVTILETLANYAGISNNPWVLTEKVREALGLQICLQYADSADKKIRAILLSQEYGEKILEHAYYPADGSKPSVAFDPPDYRKWKSKVSNAIAKTRDKGYQPIIMCASNIRQLVKAAVDYVDMSGIVVLSDAELSTASRNVAVEILGEISLNDDSENEGE